jgi:hypothetical protein
MRRSLYLHIGAHKTGSTSIQHALGTNDDRLRQHGILFPKAARVHFAHRRIVFGLRGKGHPLVGDAPDPKQELDAIVAEVEASGAATVIVTCESMFGLDKASIRFLSEGFKDFDTKVLVYIRRQDNMLLSIYNQRVKTARNQFHVSFEDVLKNPRRYVDDYRRNLDRWSAVFGQENLTVRCYETAGDVVSDFQRLVGIPFPLIHPNTPIQRNTSVSIDGVRAMSWIKWLIRDRDMRKRIFRLLKKLPLRNDVTAIMDDDDRRRILELFKADNDYVFRTYLNSDNLYDPQLLGTAGSDSATPHSAAIGAGAAVRPLR